MNESSNELPPQRGFLHSSPKKKLSFRSNEKIEDVRRGLKDAKDISARNLMAKLDCDDGAQKDSESSVEEVVVIEEVTEELEDDESAEYIEEIIEDSDDDSYLEPLPPPIEIPDALQVKDDDDDDDAKVNRNSSDDESDDDSDDEPETSPPAKVPVVTKEPDVKEPSEDPSLQKELPTETTLMEKEIATQPGEAITETKLDYNEEKDSVEEEVEDQSQSVRPIALRGMSYAVDEARTAPVAETMTEKDVSDAALSPIAWKKPDWTKNTKLRPTGKSAKDNLAKPITSLPHLKNSDSDFEPSTPSATSKPKVKLAPKTPTPSGSDSMAEKTVCPKSAPTRANAAVSMGNEDLPKIEWTKPEWTRKKVLRDTSKGQKILSGQEISRPIGGIRPVQD